MFKSLITNPKTQYRFNLICFIFFLINMPVIIVLEFLFPKFWLLVVATYIAEGTIWGVVATHLGAMSAAMSASSANLITTEVSTLDLEVADIRDTIFQTNFNDPEIGM